MSWAPPPPSPPPHWRRLPFFLDWSFEYQFNSSSHTLSEMGFANVRSKNILRSNNHRWNYKVLNLHTGDSGTMCHFFWKRKFFWKRICLHSSSDSSALVCTLLVTRLHSSTFVYICLWLVYIPLPSTSDSSVFLE